ncbi:hypothetical protein L5515_011729 [Caenorhabditis briggsae]|uniref:Uncharacterized protein n=1 Tax=Caenorhabditis briggsae TaxID=6238 RepID=A0AAE9JGV6_CAEBR|nr:hypothetical protein L5515_011729 [Caenorhabditis briggsae]
MAPTKADTIKYSSLTVLVLQNCSLVLFMRYAMTKDRPHFLKTITVFFGEIFKFSVSLILACMEEKSIVKGLKRIYHEFFVNWKGTLKVAVDNLPAATYMVTYQLKILTTAAFTVLVLHRRLSIQQWIALLVLFAGVVVVQYDQKMSNEREKMAANALANISTTLAPTTLAPTTESLLNSTSNSTTSLLPKLGRTENSILGFIAVLVACVLSGFAGIYFEKILKGSNVSIWIRNIQLAFPSIFFAFIFASITDRKTLYQNTPEDPITTATVWNNMLTGFDWAVWVTVAVNAFGGLVVAVVIKYADNILKAFATSLAIVLNCIAAYFLFNFRPSILFLVGASGVIAAVFAYSMYPYKPSHQAIPTDAPKDTEMQPLKGNTDEKA